MANAKNAKVVKVVKVVSKSAPKSTPKVKPAVGEVKTWVVSKFGDTKELGKFTGKTASTAAAKVVSKGHTNFILRQTGEHNKAKHYTGQIVKVAPKTVVRGGATFVVDTKPKTKYMGMVKL